MKNKIFIFLFISILVFTFCSCNKNDNKENGGSPTSPIENEGKNIINTQNRIADIISGGVSDYTIIYNTEEGSSINFAVSELVKYISESTGVNIKLRPDTSVDYDNDAKYISIGNTKQFRQTGIVLDSTKLNKDGFIIKTIGKNVYLNGANNRGKIYAVYDFLEKYFGIKFISENITHVPLLNTVTLYETDIVEVPAFEYRNLFSYSMRTDDELYTKLRFNAPERDIGDMYGGRTDWYTKLINIESDYKNLHEMLPNYVDFNVIHNAFYWVNPADWYETHPEFFAVNEKGVTLRDSAGTICQLNLTNGITDDGKLDTTMDVSVAKVAIESLKKFIIDDPNANVFFFGHNDWDVYDHSPKSLEMASKHGGNAGILMRFVNVLSDEINIWLKEQNIDREITIATWAYLYTKDAPVVSDGKGGYKAVDSSVIPRDNISIRIAPIELDWYYSVNDSHQNEEYASLVKKWTYLSNNFMIWTYETDYSDYLHYFPSMRQWTDNINFFKNMGVKYLMMQDNYHGYGSWQAEMHTYVAGKMMWNPSLLIQPLIDEFLYYYFGENGSIAVKEMMQMLDDYIAIKQDEDESFYMAIWNYDDEMLSQPDAEIKYILLRSEKLIRDALKYNENDTTIDHYTKNIREQNLIKALLTPQSMIMDNYADFYSDSRTAYAIDFISNAEKVGVLSLAEAITLINYKAGLGL